GGVAPGGPHQLCDCARGACAPGICGVATRRRHPALSPVPSLLWLVSVRLLAMSDGFHEAGASGARCLAGGLRVWPPCVSAGPSPLIPASPPVPSTCHPSR